MKKLTKAILGLAVVGSMFFSGNLFAQDNVNKPLAGFESENFFD